MNEFINNIDQWVIENPILGISVKVLAVFILAIIVYLNILFI